MLRAMPRARHACLGLGSGHSFSIFQSCDLDWIDLLYYFVPLAPLRICGPRRLGWVLVLKLSIFIFIFLLLFLRCHLQFTYISVSSVLRMDRAWMDGYQYLSPAWLAFVRDCGSAGVRELYHVKLIQ